jgi:hypothetical protein
MKSFQLLIVLFIFISCKKENIYYYSDNKQIKDSTVIRFIDDELIRLKINTQEKNLKIYTTLDSTSYKTNLDSIRNKTFENALTYNFKPEDKQAFDEWFREKIIVVDNKTRRVVNFYSSFKTKKNDRNDVSIGGLRKLIRIGSALNENPDSEIPENYLYHHSYTSGKELEISKKEVQFLSNFNINNLKTEGYFNNYISFLDALKLFQTYNDGILIDPFIIKKVLNKDEVAYSHMSRSKEIFSQNAVDKIQQYLRDYKRNSFVAFTNQIENTENLISFGTISDRNLIINDGKYTYLIYNFFAVITDLKKKKSKQIPYSWMKKEGINYYNAVRKK